MADVAHNVLPGEEWRPIAGTAAFYWVSNRGRVGSYRTTKPPGARRKTMRILRPATRQSGHQRVNIKFGDKFKGVDVHRLVLEAFIGPCPDGMECRHLDNDPAHNWVGNLEWNTHKVNMDDQAKFGTRCIGENKPAAKLRETDIPVIYRMLAEGKTFEQVARRFGVCQASITQVTNGITWKHVPRPSLVRPPVARPQTAKPTKSPRERRPRRPRRTIVERLVDWWPLTHVATP